MNMNTVYRKTGPGQRGGAALLVVLLIVMAATILSLGFVARSDVDLACGQNMILRGQMDCLAESGLVHAKGLILNPQDVDTAGFEYWRGGTAQQLSAGSDYYDVSVTRLGECNYEITSTGYRQQGGQEVGRSSLTAELRLDPCIAYWAGATTTIPGQVTINGDVYCAGDLTNSGTVNGDAFAAGSIAGVFLGSESAGATSAVVELPSVEAGDFSLQYYIGDDVYSVQPIEPNVSDVSYTADASNPAGVCYCDGDMELMGNVRINGALVVNGDLAVRAGGNVVTAVKNFPALVVSGQVVMGEGAELEINGLAKVSERVVVDPNTTSFSLNVLGGLFIESGGVDVGGGSSGSINVTAAPAKTALQTWPGPGSAVKWTQAAGGFFKSIERN